MLDLVQIETLRFSLVFSDEVHGQLVIVKMVEKADVGVTLVVTNLEIGLLVFLALFFFLLLIRKRSDFWFVHLLVYLHQVAEVLMILALHVVEIPQADQVFFQEVQVVVVFRKFVVFNDRQRAKAFAHC